MAGKLRRTFGFLGKALDKIDRILLIAAIAGGSYRYIQSMDSIGDLKKSVGNSPYYKTFQSELQGLDNASFLDRIIHGKNITKKVEENVKQKIYASELKKYQDTKLNEVKASIDNYLQKSTEYLNEIHAEIKDSDYFNAKVLSITNRSKLEGILKDYLKDEKLTLEQKSIIKEYGSKAFEMYSRTHTYDSNSQ